MLTADEAEEIIVLQSLPPGIIGKQPVDLFGPPEPEPEPQALVLAVTPGTASNDLSAKFAESIARGGDTPLENIDNSARFQQEIDQRGALLQQHQQDQIDQEQMRNDAQATGAQKRQDEHRDAV